MPTWSLVGNMKGDTGPIGPTGPAGNNGTNGTNGADGADGPPVFSPFTWSYDDDTDDTAPATGKIKFINVTDPTPIPVTESDIGYVEFHHEDESGIDAGAFWDLANGAAMSVVRLDNGDVMTIDLGSKSNRASNVTERWNCTILTGSFPPDGTDVSITLWAAS